MDLQYAYLSSYGLTYHSFEWPCGNWSGRYQVMSLLVKSLPTTIWSLPWWSLVTFTGKYRHKTLMKLRKNSQRSIKENFCSILQYILGSYFTIRLITSETKIHSQPNTALTSFHTKSISTNLTLLHGQNSIKMYV